MQKPPLNAERAKRYGQIKRQWVILQFTSKVSPSVKSVHQYSYCQLVHFLDDFFVCFGDANEDVELDLRLDLVQNFRSNWI